MKLFYGDPRLDALKQVMPKLDGSSSDFARNLLVEAGRGLSEKQWFWVEKLTTRATEPKREAAVIPEFSGVVALLDKAAEKLKHPKLLVRIDGQDYRLSLAGLRSAAPGSINVTDTTRGFEDRKWFGRVTRDGKFEPSRAIDDETVTAITSALKALAADPAKVASAYGQETGVCCFCGLELTDGRSVHVGYGPICAEKWCMPWGDKPEPIAKPQRRARHRPVVYPSRIDQ